MHNNLPSNHTFSNPLFIGTVVNNNDPTYSYRVKVRVPELHPSSLVDADLPWAAKLDSSFLGVSEDADLLHSVPQVGTKVLVLSVANDPNSLLYIGSLYTHQPTTPSGDDYKNTYGIYTKNGEFIGVEKLKNVFHMIWNGDLTFDVKGKIKIGSDAQEPAVLGQKLESLLQMFISAFNTHTHTGNLGMPTSPISSPVVYQNVLSNKITLE